MLTSFRLLCFSGSVALYCKYRSSTELLPPYCYCCVLTMERLFSPCTRLHDLIMNRDDIDQRASDALLPCKELNLIVSTEAFLSAERAFTYADLYAMFEMFENEDMVAWLTPNTAIVFGGERVVGSWEHLDEGESSRAASISEPTVEISSPWLSPPTIYWRFAM
jgi:hypothetical protein